MEKNVNISRYFFRLHYFPFVLAATVVTALLPILMGIENLESAQVAPIVERFFSLIGLVLFVPLFLPDVQREILANIRSKKTDYGMVLVTRLLQIFFFTMLLLAVFLLIIKMNRSTFDFSAFFLAELATVIFLGGLISLAFYFFKNLVPSLMIAIMYYVLCMFNGQKYFGPFYLFTLVERDWNSKLILFFSGMMMLILSIYLSNRQSARN